MRAPANCVSDAMTKQTQDQRDELALLDEAWRLESQQHNAMKDYYSVLLIISAAWCRQAAMGAAVPTAFVASFPATQRRRRILHQVLPETNDDAEEQPKNIFNTLRTNLKTAAADGFGTRARNVADTMKINDIVVPLCSNLDKRQRLAERGVYPGVEYKICDIDELGQASADTEQQSRSVSIRPAYPLRDYLERSWPVSVAVDDVPLWLAKATYEAGTAVGTLMLAGTYLSVAALLASFIRIAVVPSESMEPALQPGDVVLVTRSILPPRNGDVVFFNPPKELDEAIANSKVGRAAAAENVQVVSTKGKQFLKRVVGVPGDRVGIYNSNPYVLLGCTGDDCTYRVDRTGEYSRPDVFADESWNRVSPTINSKIDEENGRLDRGEYFVAGDNGFRSVDSRVWGPLKQKYLFGTAQWVIFPSNHFGPIQPGPFAVEKGLSTESH
eukprot:scaffold6832_cov81-Skeletonema_menzelii.AAC.31